ncbi:MAG: SGNH/GDSL hydrolase family protein [Planctomycetes bacterium]|nr:SGNH/GDSL hydrolase family protein [Planctomycetota bacterium]
MCIKIRNRSLRAVMAACLAMFAIAGSSRAGEFKLPALDGVRRVVFLGDSITHGGGYIDFTEAYLRLRRPDLVCEFVNLGLPSETVSGLSEPGHASGAFPRPDVHERLQRVLDQTKPDLVVACYGMNCGMYYPFSEDRFAKYQQGIRLLRERASKAGAKVLHITPPVFDPEPIRARTLPAGQEEYRQPYVGYNEVLDRYAAWLVEQRSQGWDVIDTHTPMNALLAAGRKTDPAFRLANDGVHLGPRGHWLIAQQLLIHWGVPAADVQNAESFEQATAGYPAAARVLRLVNERQGLMRNAWLSATGHLRPGVKAGLPLAEAQEKANAIADKLRATLAPQP